MLFVIAVEMLAVKIHNNSQISSICLKNEIKYFPLLQYSNDVALLLDSLKSLQCALVNNFSGVSGFKLNLIKTEGILLGPL